MLNKETFEKVVKEKLAGTGTFLVEVQFGAGNRVQVFVDKPEGITIDECVELSRFITSVLSKDVEDYDLEVSSPGLDMGFRVEEQYRKYLGKGVQVLFNDGTKLSGILRDFDRRGIDLEYRKTLKEEGKKKKKVITETGYFEFDRIKTTKAMVSFK
jgi:ribosome maturation factor RimP